MFFLTFCISAILDIFGNRIKPHTTAMLSLLTGKEVRTVLGYNVLVQARTPRVT